MKTGRPIYFSYVNGTFVYFKNVLIVFKFFCLITCALFLGETCTLHYGVIQWEIAGEPVMTSLITGKGKNER